MSTDNALIADEALSDYTVYETAYRGGKRFEPCFGRIDTGEYIPQEAGLSEDGIYLITGGAGGIGLEIAKHMASKVKVNLALAGRTEIPDRDCWDDIINDGNDKKLCARISALKELEAAGAGVIYKSLDVSDEKEVTGFIDSLHTKFGSIRGIIHCAGVAGDGFIIRRSMEQFNRVILPKIDGTWLLDKATENDHPDFFIMFSSMSTLYAAAGQGDYAAANSYMDAFAAYRNKRGKRTLTINWPSWNETGMAVQYGVSDDYTLFKSIATAQALNAFDELVSYPFSRVYVGELNFKAAASLQGKYPIMLSQSIKDAIEKYTAKNMQASMGINPLDVENISIKGIGEGDLNDVETSLSRIWARVLNINEIDVYANFHDLGGDSILATQLLKEIDKEYPGILTISDIFSYPSVAAVSEFVTNKLGSAENSSLKDNTPDNTADSRRTDDMLKGLLDRVEAGDISIEKSLSMLLDEGGE